jgi:hypothetical protein
VANATARIWPCGVSTWGQWVSVLPTILSTDSLCLVNSQFFVLPLFECIRIIWESNADHRSWAVREASGQFQSSRLVLLNHIDESVNRLFELTVI